MKNAMERKLLVHFWINALFSCTYCRNNFGFCTIFSLACQLSIIFSYKLTCVLSARSVEDRASLVNALEVYKTTLMACLNNIVVQILISGAYMFVVCT